MLIFYDLCEMCLRRCRGKKSIFGFFVSLGAKYPCDLRSMIQFWIFPKKRTLNSCYKSKCFTRPQKKLVMLFTLAIFAGSSFKTFAPLKNRCF